MILTSKATIDDLKDVCEMTKESIKEEENNYSKSNLNIFFKEKSKVNDLSLKENLENTKYKDKYIYFLAKENSITKGILNIVHIKKEDRNYIRIINIYAKDSKKEIYESLLQELDNYSKEENIKIIKMRPIFKEEVTLKESLEKLGYIIRKTTYTKEDLQVEKKIKSLSYHISFLNKRELKEAKEYYENIKDTKKEYPNLDIEEYLKSETSRILIAKKNKKIVGLLLGSIVSPHHTVSYLDLCIADTPKIEHDLINEFKRVSLNEESDDILVETASKQFKELLVKEDFIKIRESYYKKV